MIPPSNPPVSPSCPFYAGSMIQNPSLFVGREDELQAITNHMTGLQPTSVNVVGERRIGKSSLLYHFFQTWEQRVPDSSHYVVVYLSLQDAHCENQKRFYRAIANALLHCPLVQAKSELAPGLRRPDLDSASFADALNLWKQAHVLPVLCLDEFEAWLKNPQEFDDRFFDHLRSLMNDNALMLLLASLQPLDAYRTQHSLTSAFFNVGRVLFLKEFSDEEVTTLLRLPANPASPTQAALTADDQLLARQWGRNHPFLLQLAASLLCQAQQQGKELSWAKEQFEKEKERLPRHTRGRMRWWLPLRWLFWDLPLLLGKWSKWVGGSIDEFKTWFRGMVTLVLIIVFIVLAIIHVIPVSQLWNWFERVFS